MKKQKALMTHIVAGYPGFNDNREVISAMAEKGVDYIEIQIPFSDPIADGPTMVMANQVSLENGTTVAQCFDFAREMVLSHPDVKFLFMTYYNILFARGIEKFIKEAAQIGLYGLIIPDIPPEEDKDGFFLCCKKHGISAIPVISPTTSSDRLEVLAKNGGDIIYCTSSIGITGSGKKFSAALKKYVQSVQKQTGKAVAIGFNIDSAEKAGKIASFADIVVVGSKMIKIMQENPASWKKDVRNFLSDLKAAL
jgi:tryptophan synthase alpha chain